MKKTRNYAIRVMKGSTDEKRVKDYLEMMEIDYTADSGIFESTYIKFKADKKTWKVIKDDLDLAVDSVYCTFKALVE